METKYSRNQHFWDDTQKEGLANLACHGAVSAVAVGAGYAAHYLIGGNNSAIGLGYMAGLTWQIMNGFDILLSLNDFFTGGHSEEKPLLDSAQVTELTQRLGQANENRENN
jgi:hypothetical protein